MILPPPISFDPGAPDLEQRATELARRAGIYRLTPQSGAMHIGVTRNLERRVSRIARSFGTAVSEIDCWPSSSDLDTRLLLYSVTKATFPKDYLQRLRLRMPWFLVLTQNDTFPQLITTNRRVSGAAANPMFGPFASRDHAVIFEENVHSLFQMRRCPGVLAPDPGHPGCIYGEMNQCSRPCQCVVSQSEYATEVARAREFLDTSGRKLLRSLSALRDQASEELNFELAAQTHKQLERVKQALAAREDIVTEINNFSGVAVLPGPVPSSCYLRPMFQGSWQEPIVISFEESGEQRRSIDSEIRDRLTKQLERPVASGDVLEHLALFHRWYRSSWRTGEWLSFTSVQDLNYRKLVRQISKVVQAATTG